MRITSAEKQATRERILKAAKTLFKGKGYGSTTTRDIAKEVGIATGTMFNYFPSKESIVVELVHAASDSGSLQSQQHGEANSLAENLFQVVANQLRQWKAFRTYFGPVIEVAFAPPDQLADYAKPLRMDVSEQLSNVLASHGVDKPSSLDMQVLWSLYVGVLTFWIADKSRKQESTLALLDQSTQMFANWISSK
ncbi:MAG: TetR/AcrR family transcriptional regulator [Planctomycetales bacterium]|nr:TetR/AcrR family transcriptional regulator [Planctomycetales bacterium]